MVYEEILERWKKANPIKCHLLGIHTYDGQLPDLSQDSISKRISEIKKDLSKLEEFPDKIKDNKVARFEHNLIKNSLRQELFELDERKEYKESPIPWIVPLTLVETSFTVREFASVDERVEIITEFQKNIPKFLKIAKEQLKSSIALPKIQMGLKFLPGVINYFNDNLIAFTTKTDDEELLNKWSEVNIKAINVLEEFKQDLLSTYTEKSHNNFALGKDKFMKLLEYQEGVKISYENLLEAAEKDLERNYHRMLKIGDQVDDLDNFLDNIRKDYPAPDELVKAAEDILDRARLYIEETGIVNLPSDKHCSVIKTPEFAREFAFAAMNTPGPFEDSEVIDAYYWITPPNMNWSEEKRDEFLKFFNKPFLEIVTIHEVYPGHYLQLLFNQQSKSEIAKLLARSTSMIEGWAHYCEEMVFNNGYDQYFPGSKLELEVGQLYGALMRNCRFLSSLKMHCENWTPKESKELFMEKGFLAEKNAEIEANRGTIDPMYLNYTLGKLLILKLREDYKNEIESRGETFNLADFHNELLSYGSPPIVVLRDVMLENPNVGML